MRNERGFTLIELVIVIVVLGIMAALAIPKFLDIRANARLSAIQGALGGVRSAVANYYAKQAAAGSPAYPTTVQLTDTTTVMNGPIPNNPYTTPPANTVQDTTSALGTQPCLAGAGPGTSTNAWCFNATAGAFWANTNTVGVGENTF